MSTVEWRPIPGYEGLYEVSADGRVRSMPGGRRLGRERTPVPNSRGYAQVSLFKDGKRVYMKVHALVLLAFVGPRPEGTVACHNDDDKTNNSLSNLRYDTHSANAYDAVRNGKHANGGRTHCRRGHELTPENTKYDTRNPPRRSCRTCTRERERVRGRRRRLVKAATP